MSTKANQKWRDSLFTKLFSTPESVLTLYNALTDNHYPPGTPIEITSLENVLCMGRYNDISFTIDGKLVVLIEHQSTINPNMPIRLLLYVAGIYDKILQGSALHSTKLVKIPTPEFMVLYNGTADYPNEVTLNLSEAYHIIPNHVPSGGLELTVRVLNINHDCNTELVEKSVELSGYVQLVTLILQYKETGLSLEESIAKGVKDCTSKGVLVDFLKNYGGEMMSLLQEQWTMDDLIAFAREESHEMGVELGKAEGRAEGKAEGRAEGILEGIGKGIDKGIIKGKMEVAKLMLQNGISIELIKTTTGLTEEQLLQT